MNIYFIPGLGADKRIFRKIAIPAGCQPFYLGWLHPLKNESLRDYAYRLAENIDTSKPYVIVGLSFGAMLGAEIINRYPGGRIIIISSISSSNQLPFYYRMAGQLRLHRLIPVSLLKSASLIKRLFTAETPEQKAYLKMVIREVDPAFIRWGLDAIVHWRGCISNSPFLHIHGSKDLVLPVRYCSPTHVITGGGHLMILTRHEQISNLLKEFVSSDQAGVRSAG